MGNLPPSMPRPRNDTRGVFDAFATSTVRKELVGASHIKESPCTVGLKSGSDTGVIRFMTDHVNAKTCDRLKTTPKNVKMSMGLNNRRQLVG
jgi:hypothetical protein